MNYNFFPKIIHGRILQGRKWQSTKLVERKEIGN